VPFPADPEPLDLRKATLQAIAKIQTKYKESYLARFRKSSSLVFVVKSSPTDAAANDLPKILPDGVPIVIINNVEETMSSLVVLSPDHPVDNLWHELPAEEIVRIGEVVRKYERDLFHQHSNLRAIIPTAVRDASGAARGCISFLVTCKNWIPAGETKFPHMLNGFRTSVAEGSITPCVGTSNGLVRDSTQPIRPGCALSQVPHAFESANVLDFGTCGFLLRVTPDDNVDTSRWFAVSAGHAFDPSLVDLGVVHSCYLAYLLASLDTMDCTMLVAEYASCAPSMRRALVDKYVKRHNVLIAELEPPGGIAAVGDLVHCTTTDIDINGDGGAIDVAVIALSHEPSPLPDNMGRDPVFPLIFNITTHTVSQVWTTPSRLLTSDDIVNISADIMGSGAVSNRIQGRVPKKISFQYSVDGPVYRGIMVSPVVTPGEMKPGDSGCAMFVNHDGGGGDIVGMGVGFLQADNHIYNMILPASSIVSYAMRKLYPDFENM